MINSIAAAAPFYLCLSSFPLFPSVQNTFCSRMFDIYYLTAFARGQRRFDGGKNGLAGVSAEDGVGVGVDGLGEVFGEEEVVFVGDTALPGLFRRLAAVEDADVGEGLIDNERPFAAEDV